MNSDAPAIERFAEEERSALAMATSVELEIHAVAQRLALQRHRAAELESAWASLKQPLVTSSQLSEPADDDSGESDDDDADPHQRIDLSTTSDGVSTAPSLQQKKDYLSRLRLEQAQLLGKLCLAQMAVVDVLSKATLAASTAALNAVAA